MRRKGFTLIQLIVVMAVIGILVLLASPMFKGHINKAKTTQIKHDVKVVEGLLIKQLTSGIELTDNKVDIQNLSNKVEIWDTRGQVDPKDIEKDSSGNAEYYEILDKSNSKLTGTFVGSKGGKVYYIQDKVIESGGGEYVLASEEDFWWVEHLDGYSFPGQAEKGYWFYDGTDEKIEIPHKINGTTLTSYFNMFNGGSSGSLSVKSTNLNVTDMRDMFCTNNATTLDLSNLNTSNVTNMSRMFYDSQATTLDLSSFDTSKVENMSWMFMNSQAISINLSSFNTSKVTSMNSMFSSSKATKLDLRSFDTSNVENMSWMFKRSQATELDLSSFDISKVTSIIGMFSESQATTLDLSSFDTSNITNMQSMFEDSKATTGYAKTQADADKFNASSYKPSGLTFVVK